MKIKNVIKLISAITILLGLSACGSDERDNTRLITFHIANSRSIASELSRTPVVMPISGLNVIMEKKQFMYTGDLKRVDLAQITLPDGATILGYNFLCNERGTRHLMRETGANMGGYIIVLYDGNPIAVRKIDMMITDGSFFAPAEIADEKKIKEIFEKMDKSISVTEEIKKENEW